jgi:hypothetical protein
MICVTLHSSKGFVSVWAGIIDDSIIGPCVIRSCLGGAKYTEILGKNLALMLGMALRKYESMLVVLALKRSSPFCTPTANQLSWVSGSDCLTIFSKSDPTTFLLVWMVAGTFVPWNFGFTMDKIISMSCLLQALEIRLDNYLPIGTQLDAAVRRLSRRREDNSNICCDLHSVP